MADFDITTAAPKEVAEFIFKEAASTAASDFGGLIGNFVFSEALQLFGIDSQSDESQEILSKLDTVLQKLTDIESQLVQLETNISWKTLINDAWIIKTDILDDWWTAFTVTIPADSETQKQIDITNLVNAITDDTTGAVSHLSKLNDLITTGVDSDGGVFQVFVTKLSLPDNQTTSLYDAYWLMRNQADRWYYVQYLGVILQVNAILKNDPANTNVAALALTTYANNILAQEAIINNLIPAFHRIFGEVLKQQGFIRAFMFNAVAFNTVQNGTFNNGDTIPTGDDAYIGLQQGAMVIQPDQSQVAETILTTVDVSDRKLMRMTLVNNANGTTSISLLMEGEAPISIESTRNMPIIGGDSQTLNWMVWPSSNFAQLLFNVENMGTWIYNSFPSNFRFQDSPRVVTQIQPPGNTGFPFTSTDQKLYFNFDWQEEILNPTVAGQASAWAQRKTNAPNGSFWATNFKVRYCYSFLSPLGESPKSPPVNANNIRMVIDNNGFLSSGGFIFPIMIIPPDPMGLATGYKLYRQINDIDKDWVDITDKLGVEWVGVGADQANPAWTTVIDGAV